MVDSTPVDHPNAAWDSGHRGPKFASSPVVPEDPRALQICPNRTGFSPNLGASRPKFRFRILGVRKPGVLPARAASVGNTLASTNPLEPPIARPEVVAQRISIYISPNITANERWWSLAKARRIAPAAARGWAAAPPRASPQWPLSQAAAAPSYVAVHQGLMRFLKAVLGALVVAAQQRRITVSVGRSSPASTAT